MIEAKKYANKKGLKVHTHLAETKDEEEFCIKEFGVRPFKLMEDLGWMDGNSFYAHCVHMSPEEVVEMGKAQGGVAHCPTSNMRLASGIAPIVEMLQANVPVSLAVDGSASNDCSNMMLEVRNCMLLQRVLKTADCMTARDALKVATIGGAKVLGRDDIGLLQPSFEADIVGPGSTVQTGRQVTDPPRPGVLRRRHRRRWLRRNPIEKGKFTRFSKEQLSEIITKHNERSCEIYWQQLPASEDKAGAGRIQQNNSRQQNRSK